MRIACLLLAAAPLLAQTTDDWSKGIERRVEEIRGLKFQNDVGVQRRTREELRQRMIDTFDVDTPPAELAKANATMQAFGLLPPGADLKDIVIRYYTNEVAAFYDPRTKELWMIEGEQGGGGDDTVIIHEMIHAVEDQNFDLLAHDEKVKGHDDRTNALQAMCEGSATFGMFMPQWKRPGDEGGPTDYEAQARMISVVMGLSAKIGQTEDYPNLFSEGGIFPYLDGLHFVAAVYKERGWKGIDDAYASPPASTEQIIHPEKYLAGEAPVEVVLPDTDAVLGKRWERVEENTMGEEYVRLFLKEHLVVQPARRLLGGTGGGLGKWIGEGAVGWFTIDPAKAAEGWGGDRYRIYRSAKTGANALVWATTWDTPEDAEEFLEAYRGVVSKRWPGWTEERDGGDTRWSQGVMAHGARREGKDVYIVEGVPATRAKKMLDALEDGVNYK